MVSEVKIEEVVNEPVAQKEASEETGPIEAPIDQITDPIEGAGADSNKTVEQTADMQQAVDVESEQHLIVQPEAVEQQSQKEPEQLQTDINGEIDIVEQEVHATADTEPAESSLHAADPAVEQTEQTENAE